MKLMRATLAAIALAAGTAGHAADACGDYKWDVSREVQLFAGNATTLEAATTVASAPAIKAGTLYALVLKPQEDVKYAIPPSKKMLADGAYGGLLKLKVARAGTYRIAIDAGFWLDVVVDGKSLPAADFNGQRGCVGPRKIVVYELPGNVELTLQVAASTDARAKLSVTQVASQGN
jgi:hypothetical protein